MLTENLCEVYKSLIIQTNRREEQKKESFASQKFQKNSSINIQQVDFPEIENSVEKLPERHKLKLFVTVTYS